MLSQLEAFFSLRDRFVKFWKNKKKVEPESVATRFVRVFENHGVHRNQIPRFIGHGLSVVDVQGDEILLPKLTEEILDTASDRFAIRREWLDGAEAQVHPDHDFYKHPGEFLKFVKGLMAHNPDGDMRGVLIVPSENDWQAYALIILQEAIGYVGEKSIYCFHLCNNWAFTYWKARAYLTACIAIAWKRKIHIHGICKPKAFIDHLAYGETLLGWQGGGIWELGHKSLDPVDMTLKPDAFLNGVNQELDSYGLKSGLKLWLELEEQGLMDSGFGAGARQAFEEELAKYS